MKALRLFLCLLAVEDGNIFTGVLLPDQLTDTARFVSIRCNYKLA